MLVQSARNVGSKKGYSYRAYGVYKPVYSWTTRRITFRLVKSGRWFRSDVNGRTAFDGIDIVDGVRHGTLATDIIRRASHGEAQ